MIELKDMHGILNKQQEIKIVKYVYSKQIIK